MPSATNAGGLASVRATAVGSSGMGGAERDGEGGSGGMGGAERDVESGSGGMGGPAVGVARLSSAAACSRESMSRVNELISAEGSVTLLGVTIDNKLDFSEHIELLLKKGSQKIHALARISKYVSQEKLKLIMNTFVKSQFNYCPLLWMFHSRTLNNRINRLHERALRIVYQNEELSFQELLVLAGDVTVHQKNLQRLAIEMFKVKNDIAPIPFQKIFEDTNKTYNLRNQNTWVLPSMRTVHYGTETIRYRGPLIWDSLPSDLKESTTLQAFKSKIKNIRKIDCTCRLCKTFVPNLGFLT